MWVFQREIPSRSDAIWADNLLLDNYRRGAHDHGTFVAEFLPETSIADLI